MEKPMLAVLTPLITVFAVGAVVMALCGVVVACRWFARVTHR